MGEECGFPFINLLDSDVVVSPADVYETINKWKGGCATGVLGNKRVGNTVHCTQDCSKGLAASHKYRLRQYKGWTIPQYMHI